MRLDGAFDGFAPLAIGDREEEGVLTLAIDEVAHPASRVVAPEDMALVCLDEDKRGSHVITLRVKALCASSINDGLLL